MDHNHDIFILRLYHFFALA